MASLNNALYANGNRLILSRPDFALSGDFRVVSSSISVETPHQEVAYMGYRQKYISGREIFTLELTLAIGNPAMSKHIDPLSIELKSEIQSLLLDGVNDSNQALMKKIYENMESRNA